MFNLEYMPVGKTVLTERQKEKKYIKALENLVVFFEVVSIIMGCLVVYLL